MQRCLNRPNGADNETPRSKTDGDARAAGAGAVACADAALAEAAPFTAGADLGARTQWSLLLGGNSLFFKISKSKNYY